MDMNQIAVEIAYADGFDAGKQAGREEVLADIEAAMRLSKTIHVGQQFYSLVLETCVNNIKKKYGVK